MNITYDATGKYFAVLVGTGSPERADEFELVALLTILEDWNANLSDGAAYFIVEPVGSHDYRIKGATKTGRTHEEKVFSPKNEMDPLIEHHLHGAFKLSETLAWRSLMGAVLGLIRSSFELTNVN